jgi:Vitamin K epoxide reductase family
VSERSASDLSHELRQGSSPFLEHRRKIIGLSLFSSAVLGSVALYQVGILKRLPGPRGHRLNAEKVNGSAEAYSILTIPDAVLGFASCSVTACLTAAGGEDRWQTRPLLPIGMGLKMLGDAAVAAKLTIDECRKFHSFSPYSLLAAAAMFTAFPLAIPEVKAALGCLSKRNA